MSLYVLEGLFEVSSRCPCRIKNSHGPGALKMDACVPVTEMSATTPLPPSGLGRKCGGVEGGGEREKQR